MRCVAFAAISTGVFAYPFADATKVSLSVLQGAEPPLQEVWVVLFTQGEPGRAGRGEAVGKAAVTQLGGGQGHRRLHGSKGCGSSRLPYDAAGGVCNGGTVVRVASQQPPALDTPLPSPIVPRPCHVRLPRLGLCATHCSKATSTRFQTLSFRWLPHSPSGTRPLHTRPPAADFDTCTNLADDMGLRPWATQRSPGPSPPLQQLQLNASANAGGSGPREEPVMLSISSPPRSTPTTISHDFITKLMAGGPGKVVD